MQLLCWFVLAVASKGSSPICKRGGSLHRTAVEYEGSACQESKWHCDARLATAAFAAGQAWN